MERRRQARPLTLGSTDPRREAAADLQAIPAELLERPRFERPSARAARRKAWEVWASQNLRPSIRTLDDAPLDHASHLRSPLVGRDQPLARLDDAFRQVTSEHTTLLFTILGESGMGKSRLITEFVRRLPGGVRVLEGSSPSSVPGLSLWPLREMLLEVTGLTGREPGETAEHRLASFLDGVGNSDVIGRRLAPLVGFEGALGSVEESFWAVRRFFEALALRGPLILIFDDAQWASPTLLDLITDMANSLSGYPIMFLVLSWPELLDSKVSLVAPNLRHLRLAPLDQYDCLELIRMPLGGGRFDPRTESDIVGSAAGNPLFIEQCLHLMIDRGLLLPGAQAWQPVGGLSVPRGLDVLFTERTRELAPTELAVLSCGAIAGQAFYREAVEALLPHGESEYARDACMSMESRELIYRLDLADLPDATAFRFRHDLLRRIGLDRLGEAERGVLHLRYGRWLMGRSDRRGPQAASVGHHLGEAAARLGSADPASQGLGMEAAQLLLSAARRVRRTDRDEARALLFKATDLAPATSPLLIDIQVEKGRVLFDQRRLTRSELALEHAVQLAASHGEAARGTFARLLLRRVQIERGTENAAGRALKEAEEALDGARAADNRPLAVHALRTRASAQVALGQFGDAKASLADALGTIAPDGELASLFRSVRREQVSLTRWGPEPVTE